FTFLLLVVVLYWVVAVLGLIEIDVLDFDIPEANGIDINAEQGLNSANVLAGLMLRFGLHGVPVTIILSFIALFGWVICYYVVHFLMGILPEGLFSLLASIPILLGSLYISVMITAALIKPLRPLFKKASQETVKRVLGQTAVVKTSRVDNSFGEATLEDGGAGLLLKVRTDGSASFSKGDRVVLLEYNKEENTYRVISEDDFAGS
ncbi:OB-fold-containig protein, partial [Oleiphilus sp. HI0067]